VDEYFGTVPDSMITIFQVFTLDKPFSHVLFPVMEHIPLVAIPVLFFICVGMFAVMSLIIAVPVENTLTSAKRAEEEFALERKAEEMKVMRSLRRIFYAAGKEKSNELSRKELTSLLRRSHMKDRLKLLELTSKDLTDLFDLLVVAAAAGTKHSKDGEDDRNSQAAYHIDSVKTNDFFRSCMRIRGPAMSADMAKLSVDLQRNADIMEENDSLTENLNRGLDMLLNNLGVVDRDIMKSPGDEKDEVLMRRRERFKFKDSTRFQTTVASQELANARRISSGGTSIGWQGDVANNDGNPDLDPHLVRRMLNTEPPPLPPGVFGPSNRRQHDAF